MDRALVVGSTRLIGRHTVDELLAHGYVVTIFNRGRDANPFATDDRVAHVEGDRTDAAALERDREVADSEVVIDCVALHPDDVRTATDIFADALDTDVEVEVVTASERELSAHDLAPSEFPQYTPDPMVVGSQKLAALGWRSTSRGDAVAAHTEDYLDDLLERLEERRPAVRVAREILRVRPDEDGRGLVRFGVGGRHRQQVRVPERDVSGGNPLGFHIRLSDCDILVRE